MFQNMVNPVGGSGGTDIHYVIHYTISGTPTSIIDSDYVSVSADHATITFLKKVKGYIAYGTGEIDSSSTATYTKVVSRAAGTWNVAEFEANANQTIVIPSSNYWQYDVFCIDA